MDFPKSVPSVGLVDGKFVDEDVVAGTPGSLIPAQWGNAVTEELLNVIESAGLTPDEDNNAQLLAAVNSKIAAAIPSAPPDASTTVKGLVELATSLEAQTGTDPERAITPLALSARTATDARTGLVELATNLETQTGTDPQRAVTPAGLASIATTSTLDATVGKLARIGDFGIGGFGPDAANVDTITAVGVYSVSGSSAGTLPSPGMLGTLFHLERSSSLARAQILVDSAGVFWYRSSVFGTGAWRSWSNNMPTPATTSVAGVVELATSAETTAGADSTRAVVSSGLQTKMSGVVSGQYPITPGSQAVFNHNLGVIPFMVEFSFVCLTAEGGWSAGDVIHRGNWYQNSSGTDISVGIFWYGETTTQVTFGIGSVAMLLPTKTTGFRFGATASNWRFTARVIG
ncbi:hypothetical protein QZH45_14255 [Pseudomonas corrugata]|uniref:hypothetical protein n=1 Tax=Pseudomonas corrugata TaxID=47879 RepID=UPI003D815284